MTEVGDRLRYLIESQGYNISSFSRKYAISGSSLNEIALGNRNLGINTLDKLIEIFPNLNANWILYGRGEMFYMQNVESELPHTAEPVARYDLTNDPVRDMFLKYLDVPEVQEKIKQIINPPRKAKQTNKIIKSRILDDRDLAFALGLDPSTFEDLDVDPVLEQQINEALDRDNIELAVSLIKEALAHKNVSHEKK